VSPLLLTLCESLLGVFVVLRGKWAPSAVGVGGVIVVLGASDVSVSWMATGRELNPELSTTWPSFGAVEAVAAGFGAVGNSPRALGVLTDSPRTPRERSCDGRGSPPAVAGRISADTERVSFD
jgi:drug/metabolite transporter (DMT)-like permease